MTKAMIERGAERFTESSPFDLVSLSEAVKGRIDRTAGLIKGVKLMGLESRNGRRYRTPEAALFEGVQVRMDHHGKEGRVDELPNDPSLKDVWATTTNVKVDATGVYADLKYNKAHPLMESILWWAEHAPNIGGFSPITWSLRTIQEGETIMDILMVESVDLVGRPATTKGFFESEAGMDPKEVLKLQESLAAKNVEVTSLTAKVAEGETALAAEKAAREAAEKRATEAEGKIATMEAESKATARKNARDGIIAAGKLPEDVVTAEFREAVHAADTDEKATKLVEAVSKALGAPRSQANTPADTLAGGQAKPTHESLADLKKAGILDYDRSAR